MAAGWRALLERLVKAGSRRGPGLDGCEADRKRRLGADADQPHRIRYRKLAT